MNIFLTGHGFIATALKNYLERHGYSVYQPERWWMYQPTLMDYFKTQQVDVIIHTAAYGNMAGQDNAVETATANVTLLHNLLLASKDNPYNAFLNFSTSAIQLPVQTLYSTTKAMGEELVIFYAKTYYKPIVNIRPFSVTGVGEQESHLIPTLIRAAYTGEAIPFVPHPAHDFIDVSDVVTGVMKTIDQAETLRGQHVELGTGLMYRNEAVRSLVEVITDRMITIHPVDSLRTYDTKQWAADTTKRPLGWYPVKTLEDSIREMIEAYEQNR